MANLARWTKEKDVRILMLGLDSAGKVRGCWPSSGTVTDSAGVDDNIVQVTGISPLFLSTKATPLKCATVRLERLFRLYPVS